MPYDGEERRTNPHTGNCQRVIDLAEAHADLENKFARYDGKVMIYQLVVALLQTIIMVALLWVGFSITSLQRDNAIITTKLGYIEKAIGSTKKVSQYNQRLLKGGIHAR